MSLIKCPECGKEISDKAISCPNCGLPLNDEIMNKEYKCMLCGSKTENKNMVCDKCIRDYEIPSQSDDLEEYNGKYEENVNRRRSAIACPNCGSDNVNISIQTVGETSEIRNETRKKSIITRKANKKARKGMILATGGLWALTPKKSEYKDTGRVSTSYQQVRVCVCQKCGNAWYL